MSLLLALAGAVVDPPEDDAPFYAIGGNGIARRPAAMPAATRSAAMRGGDLIAMEAEQAAERDARDLREAQELIAALFTFKGIF